MSCISNCILSFLKLAWQLDLKTVNQTHYCLFDVICHSNRLQTRLGSGPARFLVVLLLEVKLIIATEVSLFSFPAGPLLLHSTIP